MQAFGRKKMVKLASLLSTSGQQSLVWKVRLRANNGTGDAHR